MNARMNMILGMVALLFTTASAGADSYDDKARAASQYEHQIAVEKAVNAANARINKDNSDVVRRIPKGATITNCFDRDASFYRQMANGCRLENSEWNGIPVQVCSESYKPYGGNYNLPPEIVSCHYKLPDGRDCRLVRNPTVKPTCY